MTDGLDGLAGIIVATAFMAYGIIAVLQDQQFLVTFSFITTRRLFRFSLVQRQACADVYGRCWVPGIGRRIGRRGPNDQPVAYSANYRRCSNRDHVIDNFTSVVFQSYRRQTSIQDGAAAPSF